MLADLRYALRRMRRSPGFTAAAVLSLALGIGANTAIFSLVETALLRMLPVPHPDRLVELLQQYPGEPRGSYWSPEAYDYFRSHNHVFSSIFGTGFDNRGRISSPGLEPQAGVWEAVTGNYFSSLGIQPALGHWIGPSDVTNDSGAPPAVISYSLWSSRFHRDPSVLGKPIQVNDTAAVIAGVAPPSYSGPRVEARTDVWLPRDPSYRGGYVLLARLAPGVSLARARAEMAVLYPHVLAERIASSPDPQVRKITMQVEPAGNGLSTVRDRFGKPLFVLMLLVGLLLLLACLNLAGMLLARAASRSQEMALRASLGASRFRLLRQVLTESLLLSFAGTLAGAAVAYFGASSLLGILASARLHERVYLRVRPDLNVFLFTAAVAAAAALLFGAAPALAAFRAAPSPALRQSGAVGQTRLARLFGGSLVAAQVSLSILLLSSAALFISNLASLETTYLGFQRDHILLFTPDSSSPAAPTGPRLVQTDRDLLARFSRIPGVLSASLSGPTPLQGAGASAFASVDGFIERPEDRRWISIAYTAPGYFDTLGTPLLSGRDFTFADSSGPLAAIVNQAFAHYYFPNRNPIGARVTLNHVTLNPAPLTCQIVGVSADAHYYDIREPVTRTIYLPAFFLGDVRAETFLLRTSINPASVASSVRAIAGRQVESITTLTQQIDASIVPERLIATLSGFFAALGAVLAGTGLFALLAYSVARRTSEIGIRIALGANPSQAASLVLRQSLLTVLAGLALGLPLALWTRSLAVSILPGLPSPGLAPVFLASLAIATVAFAASYIPARRAARINPADALRHE